MGKSLDKVKAYFLSHPEATILEAVKETGVSQRTVARARGELVTKNLMHPGRNNRAAKAPPVDLSALAPLGDTVLTSKTMEALAEAADMSDILDLDDEELRKKLLRGVIKIALDPKTHPDTQLSATQVWAKLKDMARVNDLGPGKPVTKTDAVDRLVEMLVAVGSEIAITAMYRAFNVKEPTNEGEVPTDTASASPSPAGPPESPGSPPNLYVDEAGGNGQVG